jgi:carboxymethylenebutenolidase
MKAQCLVLFALLPSGAAFCQPSRSIGPYTVEIPSGALHLKAFFWMPNGPGQFSAVLFNHGSGGEDTAHTAGMPISEAAERLAPLFLHHGYAFLYPFRRGHGLSADQAPFLQDLLQREEATRGKEARQHLHFVLLTTEQLNDVTAALRFPKGARGIDARRIALVGHSFGGNLALLAAERDRSVRAVVTFAAAANSWGRSREFRERLLAAVRATNAPIMLVHAANDYSTTPGTALAAQLEQLQKPHLLKIYPPVGKSSDDGHNLLYLAIPQWELDVFRFLDDQFVATH